MVRQNEDERFYKRQAELLGDQVAQSDVVIAAAVVSGKKSPVLVTREMLRRKARGYRSDRKPGRTDSASL